MEIAARAQPAHFVDEAGRDHRREALVDSRMQPGTVARLERDQRRRSPGRRGVPRRERPAADAMDLERALDPLAVVGREPRGGDGVDRRELGVQGRPAFAGGACVDRGAHFGVGGGHRVEAVEPGLEVEHRAADQERDRAARADRLDRRARVGNEARRRVALRRVGDVDAVVRDRGAVGGARLGGADVHAAVDERRIDADDLDGVARRERRCDGERCGALAGRGRSGEAEAVDRARAHRIQRKLRLFTLAPPSS